MKKLLSLIFFLLSFWSSSVVLEAFQYELTICAIFQNDATWLPEWIEFHEKQGVEHFYLYNNLSTDNYLDTLQPYIDKGLVTLTEWPKPSNNINAFNLVQTRAYVDCIKKIAYEAKWCALIDTDEFLFSVDRIPLKEILKQYDQFAGVVVNWACYGTSGIQKIPAGEKITHTLLLRAPLNSEDNRFVKSIVKPIEVETCDSPHYVKFKPNKYCVTENRERHGNSIRSKTVSVNILRINHYWARDLDFFYNVKIDRALKWGYSTTEAIERESKMNAEYDGILLNF